LPRGANRQGFQGSNNQALTIPWTLLSKHLGSGGAGKPFHPSQTNPSQTNPSQTNCATNLRDQSVATSLRRHSLDFLKHRNVRSGQNEVFALKLWPGIAIFNHNLTSSLHFK